MGLNKTIELNPSKFLDINLPKLVTNGVYKFNVYWKNTKLPSPWTSKTLKRYQHTIRGDLHLSKAISSNADEEILLIKENCIKTDYSLHFINNVVHEFQKAKACEIKVL